MKIYKNLLDLVGNTPLMYLSNYCMENNLNTKIIAKLEKYNPAGSIKDRVAKNMIEEAEKIGKLKKGSVIIEPTSGNTGIGLAFVAMLKKYKVILVMPENMSIERQKLLKAYGAEIVLTNAEKGMTGAVEKAKKIADTIENSYIPSQFTNLDNCKTHYNITGPEIWEATEGKVDVFISTVGTGGTLTGTAEFLKEKNPNIKIIAVEPEESPLLSKGIAGKHGIQGIGANFVPEILNTEIYDEIVTITTEEAYETVKQLVITEGLLVGISSGAAVCAVKKIASKFPNKNIVVILPDSGERYLSEF